jgi:HEPN domain-containing protein
MKRPEDTLKALVDAWIHKADQDILAVERLREYENVLGGVIAFHAQQAVEKYMKAVLTKHQIAFPKTHDLGVLLTILVRVEPSLSDELADATVLTDYGVEIRYPGDLPDLTHAEVREAVDVALHASDILKTLLQS